MTIEWYRDLVIIVLGIVACGFFIFLSVIIFDLYRQAKSLQNSVKDTLSTVRSIAAVINDVFKPLLPLVALIQGVSQGIKGVTEILEKIKGGNHGQ